MNEKIEVEKVEVRDLRKHGWYWIEDELLKEHGEKLGPYGIAIYNVLCLHAHNKTQKTYPSVQTMARLTGMSRTQAFYKLEEMEKMGLILAEHLGPPKPTIYTLVSLKKQEDEESEGGW